MVGVVAFFMGLVLLVVVGLTLLLSSSDVCEDVGVTSAAGVGVGVGSTGGFALPEENAVAKVTSEWRPPARPNHQGIDIGGGLGSPIYAFADGVVTDAGPASGFGQWIVIEHNFDGKKYLTVYGHMYEDGLHVKAGDKVSAGQHIADEGSNGESSGPHLHFEIWENSRIDGNDRNPRPWLEKVAAGEAPAEVTGFRADEDADSVGFVQASDKTRRGSGSGVLIIGDSITVGAQEALERKLPGVVVDAAVGRQFTEGVGILEGITESYKSVVLALGTNGEYSQADVDAALQAAGGAEVYLMTVAGAKVSSASVVNKVVKANSSKVGVVDWAAEVKRTEGLIGADGVHPTDTGYVAFATVVARSVKDSASGGGHLSGRQELVADEKRFPEGGLQRETVRLGRMILVQFPEIELIGGYRPDSLPDHPSGQAIDIMIPGWETAEGKKMGDEVVDFVLENAEEFSVKYTIWRQWLTPIGGTAYMMADQGSPNNNHFNHVHVTVNGTGYPEAGEEYFAPGGLGDVTYRQVSSTDCLADDVGHGHDVGFSKDQIPPELHKWIRLGGRVCKAVPSPLLAAVIKQESSFQQQAVSEDGAQGYAQFMPDTWAQEGREVDENGEPIGPPGSGSPYEAKDAIMASARYLCGIYQRQKPLIASGAINGDPTKLMLAGYNAGEGAVQGAGGVPVNGETELYVEIITEDAKNFREEI